MPKVVCILPKVFHTSNTNLHKKQRTTKKRDYTKVEIILRTQKWNIHKSMPKAIYKKNKNKIKKYPLVPYNI